jgi:hypothetical protein
MHRVNAKLHRAGRTPVQQLNFNAVNRRSLL